MKPISILLIGLAMWLSGCGSESRDLENYGTGGNQAAQLTHPQEHYGGYGRSQCLICHNTALNVHRDIGSPIDADELNKAAANSNGDPSAYCLGCHGRNGT